MPNGANARVVVFETPYMYNMIDGKQYPLLADGDYTWNDARTEITFKIKPAAKWSDGTPVTADDVAYTWATHLKYETTVGVGYKDYIDTIVAVDPQTVMVKAKLDEDGKAINPLHDLLLIVSDNYVHPESLDPETGSPRRRRCCLSSKPIPVTTSLAPVLTPNSIIDDQKVCPDS